MDYDDYQIEHFKPSTGEVHIRFYNFFVFGTLPQKEDTLFYADRLYLSLNLHNILFQKVKKIDSVYVENLNARLFVDSLGRKNYRIFPPYNPNRENPPPEILLKKAFFKNTSIRYFSEGKNKEYDIFYDTVKFSLRVFPHDLEVQLYCNGKLNALKFNSVPFVEDRKVKLSLHFFFDKSSKMVELRKGSFFTLEGIPFFLTGSAGIGALRNYNMQVYAPKATLKTLIDLLPAKVRKLFEPYRIGGEFEILGNYYATHFSEAPALKLNFQCSEGFIFSKVLNAGIEHIRFRGEFSNGKERSVKTTYLALDSIQAFLGERPIIGSAKFYDLTDIKFQGHLLADLAVKDLLPFLGTPIDPRKTQGEISIRLKNQETSLAQIQTKKGIDSLHYDGKISFKNIRFALKEVPYSFSEINGNLFFAGHFAKIPSLRFLINNQPFEIKDFYMERPVSYVLGIVPKLKYRITLEGKKTNIEKLFTLKKNRNTSNLSPFGLLDFLKNMNMEGHIFLRFINFTYQKHFFDKARLTLNVAKDTFAVPFFGLEFPATKIYGNFFMNEVSKNKHRFNVALNFKSEDLAQTLRKFFDEKSSFYLKLAEKSPVFTGGNFFVTGNIDTEKQTFSSQVMFYEGFIYGEKLPISLKGVKFSAYLSPELLARKKDASLTIRNLQMAINISEQVLGGDISLKNVFSEKPLLQAQIRSYLDFEEMSYILGLGKIVSEPEGKILFTVNIEAPLKELLKKDFRNVRTQGKVTLENLKFKNSGILFSDISSEIENKEKIHLKFLTGKIQGQPFKIVGEVPYFLKFISDPFREKLIASFDVFMDTLNLNKIRLSTTSKKDSQTVNILFPPRNNLKLNLQVRKFYFRKWQIDDFSGKIVSRDNFVQAKYLYFNALGGTVKLSAFTKVLPEGKFPTRVNFNFKNLNVKKLFYNLDEFNQDFFTSENIEGIVSAKGSFFYVFKQDEPKVNFSRAELSIYDLHIHKGRILNFKPLQSLKIFKKRMENPVFRIYGRNFTLNRGKFNIPYLVLNSSVADLYVSGYITVNFDYRYYVTVVNPTYKKRRRKRFTSEFSLMNFIIEGTPKNVRVIYNLKESWRHFKRLLGKIIG